MHSEPSVMPREDSSSIRSGERVLFVASTGGHLAQLHRLSGLYAPSPDSVWVTFDTPQSRSLLEGKRTLFVPYVKPRDTKGVWKSFRLISRFLESEAFDRVISTGAGLAVGAFFAARLSRVPCRYIESVSRVEGPSLTGRIVDRLRLADMYTQHEHWATAKWKVHPSVLSRYKADQKLDALPATDSLKVFVTLGTIRPYPFKSAVDAVLRTEAVNSSTVWQLGSTVYSDLPGSSHQELSSEEFVAAARSSDVVITHAGVGTILQLLEMGIHPVVLPRKSEYGEHVDDHQLQITKLVSDLGIATAIDPRNLTIEHLQRAANLRTVTEIGVDSGQR